MNRLGVALIFILCMPLAAAPQQQPTATQPHADYSREPFVIEQYFTTARFENDGTSERDLTVRIRVQSDAGAQQLKELVFDFDSSSEKMEVRYARVRQPDGTIVTAAADAVKEVSASIVRDAPAYGNAKEKHIAVPSLAPGTTLEYEIATRVVAPPAPGEFWFEHSFVESAIVLDERFEINVLESRTIILKSSPASPYETSHENGRTIYRWKRSNLTIAAGGSSKGSTEQGKSKPPDVQLTTFANWQDVGRWYAKLAQGRAEPAPEIRSAAQDLIKGSATSIQKIQALYDYVSKNIRSVSLPFGAAGYRPRSASEVLSSKYADPKDKHTLLAAMLQAAGISSDIVLISPTHELDASVPSPSQFDHVITAVPLGEQRIWMDATPEVAPFRLLASPLRGKSALLVSVGGIGKIVETPADPPFLSVQHVDIDGQVSDLGKLTARAHYSVRGDTELVLRLAFHRTPENQWRDLGQTILSLDGIRGDVNSVKPGDPTATHDPFQLDIEFAQPGFLDWSSKHSKAAFPLLAIGLPDAPEKNAASIQLGSPLDVTVRLKLALPPDYIAQPPVSVSVARDYAAFSSSYRFADHTVTAERSLDFKMRELAASRADDFLAFSRTVAADQNQPLVVINTTPGAPAVPSSASVDSLIESGLAALNAGNARSAIPLFKRVVELDPAHKQAWNDLGLSDFRIGQFDEAVAAFRKQLEINPSDAHANDYLGLALEHQQNFAEAAAAFHKQIELDPLDATAHTALGEILLGQHEYAQAAPELDKAAILSPDDVQLQLSLGRAYANTGDAQKALAAFEKAAALSPTPAVWNDIAYDLADSKLDLDKAQHYSESAIAAIAPDLRGIDLQHLTVAHLNAVAAIGLYWDTLGWVYFQKGDLQSAGRYVNSAWLLDQNGEIGDHLAQIYEKLGQKDRAIHAYALALAAPNSVAETRARLTLLLGGNSQIDGLVSKAKPEIAALRAIPAGELLDEETQADFFILLSPAEKNARVDAVRFVSGSERLRALADRLRALDYGVPFPDASPLQIVRRATLSCPGKGADCTLTLVSPEDVHAVN